MIRDIQATKWLSCERKIGNPWDGYAGTSALHRGSDMFKIEKACGGEGDGDQRNQFRSYKEVSELELGGR